MTAENGNVLTTVLAALFFLVSVVFVLRSFYSMRIGTEKDSRAAKATA